MTRLFTLLAAVATLVTAAPAAPAAHKGAKAPKAPIPGFVPTVDPVLVAFAADHPEIGPVYAYTGTPDQNVAPIGLAANTDGNSTVAARDTRLLANPNGPDFTDIKQTNLNDCWIDASLIALTYISKWWPFQAFSTGHNVDVSVLNVTLSFTDRPKFWATVQSAWTPARDNEVLGGQSSTAGTYWWPSAFDYAYAAYGKAEGDKQLLLDGGWARYALGPISGYPAGDDDQVSNYYGYFLRASTSPITLGTWNYASTLVKAHEYAVLWGGKNSQGVDTLILRNPWGITASYPLATILSDIRLVTYLKGYPKGPK